MWSRHTVIEAVVHCNDVERSLERLPGFEPRLRKLFPTIGELRRDASLAQVLEQATLALQAQAGCPVTFSQTHVTPEAGTYQIVIEYSEEDVGRLAFEHAVKLVMAALDGGEFDADAVLAVLRELDEDIRLGPSTGSIVNAALARGIPFRRLTQGSLVQFGWGAKQRRIWAAEVDATSAVSESIAPGQGPLQATAAGRRRTGAHRPSGRVRRRRLGRGRGDRLACCRQAAGRQPGQGRDRQRHDA